MYTDNDFRLYHHGILGQRWGVRNGPPYPLSSDAYSSSENAAKKKKKKLKDLTNEEIRQDNERQRLEKEYRRNHPTVSDRAKNELKRELKVAKTATEVWAVAKTFKEIAKAFGAKDSEKKAKKMGDVANEQMMQIQTTNAAIQAANDANQLSIQEANRAMSLAVTNGMTPFMFGGKDTSKAKSKPSAKTRILRVLADNYEDNSSLSVAKREDIEKKANLQRTVDKASKFKNAKGLSAKSNELLGPGAAVTYWENEAKKYDKLAKTYKNERMANEYKRKARNARYEADSYRESSNNRNKGGKTAAKQFVRDVFKSSTDRYNTKYEDVDGRIITKGQKAFEDYMYSIAMESLMDDIFK